MRFEILQEPGPIMGRPVYRTKDYAFAYEVQQPQEGARRRGHSGIAALSLNTLQIDVAIESGLWLWASGYCPHTSWRERVLTAPSSKRGALRVIPSVEFVRGVSIPVGPAW